MSASEPPTLRFPSSWARAPGSRFLHTPPGPTDSSPSVSPRIFGPLGSLREMSRPASPGQRRLGHSSAGHPATHQVGQSNSGRLEPEFAAAAILLLPLPFGGPEARRETGRPRGERRLPISLCVCARAPTHARMDAQKHRALLVVGGTGVGF